MTNPIVVDIGAAMTLLESNPELTAKLNELAFGKVAADQLAAREALILEMGEALETLYSNITTAGDEFEDGNNDTAWEFVLCAKLKAKQPLANYRAFAGVPGEIN